MGEYTIQLLEQRCVQLETAIKKLMDENEELQRKLKDAERDIDDIAEELDAADKQIEKLESLVKGKK